MVSANGVRATTSLTVTNSFGAKGRTRQTPASLSNKDIYAGAWSRIPAPLTLVVMYQKFSAAFSTRIAGNLSASNYGYGIAPNTTNFRAIISRSGVNTILTGAANHTRLKVDALVVDATNGTLYEDGLLTAGPTAHGGMATPTGDFSFGAENGASNTELADYYFAALFSRALTLPEIKSISANPWQVFEPAKRKIWVPSSGTGPTYTLTAASGSFALTGGTASLIATRNLSAASGSFAETGSAAKGGTRPQPGAGKTAPGSWRDSEPGLHSIARSQAGVDAVMERIQVTRYVSYGCKRRFATKKRCLEHEANCTCWTNPKNKTCKTCEHGEHDSDDGIWLCNNDANYEGHSGAPESVDYISVNCSRWEEKGGRP